MSEVFDIHSWLENCGCDPDDVDYYVQETRDLLKLARNEPIDLTESSPPVVCAKEILEAEASYITNTDGHARLGRDSFVCDLSGSVFWTPDRKRAVIHF